MKINIINGPNLNLLGKREPEVYGNASFETCFEALQARFPNVDLNYFQSNVEGVLIDHLHNVGFESDGIVLNAGGYTHTSVAISDAISGIKTPVIEVHISNIYARETYRHHSIIAAGCVGSITGLGMEGYRLAIDYFVERIKAS